MCKNLLYPCSQTPKDISHMRPEGCFPVGCLSLGQGICLSEGRWVRVFLQSRCGRWWHFPLYQISSLDDHAVGHGEKLCLTVCSQGLFFLTSSVTLLFTEPWNSLPQASMEAKGLGIFQEEQGLFPGWEFPEWHWMGKKKKKSSPNWWTPSASKEGNQELEVCLKWFCSDFRWCFSHQGQQQ